MALLFLGKDPNTNGDDCPTVWVDDTSADLVLQGWKADAATEQECLTVGHIPDNEAVIRIPARMVPLIRKACDEAGQRSAVQ
ncbi:hypothetical protein CP981_23320 [Streptomyces platensis]|uniref:Uncharacterized protein n=1 Tax=Streptomyces platensis TaxID=58346 RepID=A0AAE6NK13_STRPT|nr:hypothetical protein [Streptomyces platensis]OSY43028.1 hypothetical protein BG653_04625 [Streptomyces platensis]QEV54177.1 hypothetical protein CP981_23320 [Streptomyces platensis]BCK69229.1 hypothetical protein Srufu_031820 [Streptomyces libani subsp. rufus]